jgi:hypothetical protein
MLFAQHRLAQPECPRIILNLSGAGDSIDRILRDMDEGGIKENGSTELGQYISLKLGSWLDGVPVC